MNGRQLDTDDPFEDLANQVLQANKACVDAAQPIVDSMYRGGGVMDARVIGEDRATVALAVLDELAEATGCLSRALHHVQAAQRIWKGPPLACDEGSAPPGE
jgi:hypothetical protein